MKGLFRSLLFVPGNNQRFLEKAKAIQADIVCFDLEDSVPDSEKENARKLIRKALEGRSEYAASVYVRTNSPASGKIPDDLEQVVRKGLDGIVIPKVDSAKDVLKIKKAVSALEKKRKIGQVAFIPSIESALGVVNAFEISSSSKRVAAVVFGVFDLLNDMGIEYTKQAEGAIYARAQIPLCARAAGVPAIDAIWQDLGDKDGLLHDCIAGKNLGYSGKSIIHPDQIPVSHEAFAPNKAELDWAKKVCDVYLASTKRGRGATVVDGKMIDEVHYKQAKALLDVSNDSRSK